MPRSVAEETIKKRKKYYVIYVGKDVGWYETVYFVVCIVENEEVAKDICKKFNYHYKEEIVGEERSTPHYVKSKEVK